MNISTDEQIYQLVGVLADAMGMNKNRVVEHSVREFAASRGLIERQHPQFLLQNHGTAQGRRNVQGVDAPTKQAQESIDVPTCTSSQHKEGVGARDGLLRVVESTSQNAAPSPQNQALVSPPSGAGH